jgi:hypothetical protein
VKASVALLVVLLAVGCKKDQVGPEKILGKWEEFYVGNGEYRPPIDPPIGYREFQADSVLIDYNYSDKSSIKKKYWIDSQLHVAVRRVDGFLLQFDYEYSFEADTLKLTWVNANPVSAVSKYRRIN